MPDNLKKEILRPTKIYSKEVLKLTKKNLINSAAHITGGGLVENLLRSVPKNLTLNIDLSKIKTTKIFNWLKSKNISDKEMMRTFNCGVGFCLIVSKKKIYLKSLKYLKKNLNPMKLDIFLMIKKKVNIFKSFKW